MRVRLLAFLLLASGATQAAQESAVTSTAPITLQECYEHAKQISETIGISAENTRVLQNQYRAELGAVLPHIDWIKTQFYQENANAGGSGVGGSLARTTQPESYFQIQQPIFAGFRDWAAIDIAKSQQLQSKFNERLTDLHLLSDVATAFYSAYTAQDSLAVLQQIRRLNQDQVEQLNHWVNIGRSRSSEVLSAQTQMATIDAQITETQRAITEARHLLLFLAGVPAEVPLKDDPPVKPSLTLEEALGRAGNRPELLSAAEGLHQAELGIRYARGAHYPILSALGRYYTERVGFLTDVRWDATFTLDVPLYEGGSTQALVRASRSQEIIAQLTLAHIKRDVERDVHTAYDNLTNAVSEVEAFNKAVELADKNYVVQQKEYRLGTITNLDLLQLLTNMQNVRGQWLVSRANARLDDIRFRIAMGEGL